MDYFKLGVGPMSDEINHIIDQYAEKTPLMVVASRNQVDYRNSYVCPTNVLPSYLSMRSNILLCRDHCGPYFKDTDKGLSVDEAIRECKETIRNDVKAGFDLIHIDVSRIPENQLKYAKELYDFALDLDSSLFFEFGSEDNTGEGIAKSIERIDEQLEFLSNYKNRTIFFVSQTGSYTKHTQVGSFDVEVNKSLAERIHNAGFKFKEHNADYLTGDQVRLRKEAGVDALNIAPQLGAIQTRLLMDLSRNTEWEEFAKMVYEQKVWKKWMPDSLNDFETSVIVSGHYFYNTPQYKKLKDSINVSEFNSKLKEKMFDVFDLYIKGLV